MRGMILAAGRGVRMGNLTAQTPKPLLQIAGRYLIEYSIAALVKAGINEIVINVSYLREKIKTALGDGANYGVTIHYSEEEEALETGGGILNALPLLEPGPFVVLSSDIICNYSLQDLSQVSTMAKAHIVLVNNPVFHPAGDFSLEGQRVCFDGHPTYTYANIGLYYPELFANCQPGKFRLAEVLRTGIDHHQVSGELFQGKWFNVGAPDELANAEKFLLNLE